MLTIREKGDSASLSASESAEREAVDGSLVTHFIDDSPFFELSGRIGHMAESHGAMPFGAPLPLARLAVLHEVLVATEKVTMLELVWRVRVWASAPELVGNNWRRSSGRLDPIGVGDL
jgi:hypothetical protein